MAVALILSLKLLAGALTPMRWLLTFVLVSGHRLVCRLKGRSARLL